MSILLVHIWFVMPMNWRDVCGSHGRMNMVDNIELPDVDDFSLKQISDILDNKTITWYGSYVVENRNTIRRYVKVYIARDVKDVSYLLVMG